MRLFQSHMPLEAAVEPAPSFLRDPTREHLKTLVHYRDTRHRLPTPDKVAIMELSHSFEKRRLGKQRQILTEMNQRCREQEISDLSTKLSAKCSLSPSENKIKEMTFYSTNMMPRHKQRTYVGAIDVPDPRALSPTSPSSGTVHEKTYKHFPARRVIKNNGKFDFVKSPIQFERPPRISPILQKNSNAMYGSHDSLLKTRLMRQQRINGTVQLEHLTPRMDTLAPLSLPTLDTSHQVDTHVDAISASRVQLESRNVSNYGLDSTWSSSTKTHKSSSQNRKRQQLEHLNTEQPEMHLPQSVKSPIPDSAEQDQDPKID